jgi:phospholipid/cholesterol/gamma-HCH transport system substrate-binding protein
MRRVHRRELSPFVVGLIAIVVVIIVAYAAFVKEVPWGGGFVVKAVFTDAKSIRPSSPVRVAGVNVGEVTSVERYKDTEVSLVTMELKDEGLPVFKDAQMQIRPRLFLEGNWFVDLSPGSPGAGEVGEGDTIPISQTATSVQINEVLSALQYDTRTALQLAVQNLGTGLSDLPGPPSDPQQNPEDAGQTGAQALNETLDYSADALKGVALVNEALLGEGPNDLTRLVANLNSVLRTLRSRQTALQNLITNFNTTLRATADSSAALSDTIAELPPTLNVLNETLDSLNAAFPPTRAFALELTPSVRQLGPTIDVAFPWIRQSRALFTPAELRGLAQELRPTIRSTARVADEGLKLFPEINDLSRCLDRVVLPTGDIQVIDPPHSVGVENYKEFWYSMVGLAGEGQSFDGNGSYVRFNPGGGNVAVGTGSVVGHAGERLFGSAVTPPIGARPKRAPRTPPFNTSKPCYTQPIPNLNGPAAVLAPGENVLGPIQPVSAADSKDGKDKGGKDDAKSNGGDDKPSTTPDSGDGTSTTPNGGGDADAQAGNGGGKKESGSSLADDIASSLSPYPNAGGSK